MSNVPNPGSIIKSVELKYSFVSGIILPLLSVEIDNKVPFGCSITKTFEFFTSKLKLIQSLFPTFNAKLYFFAIAQIKSFVSAFLYFDGKPV